MARHYRAAMLLLAGVLLSPGLLARPPGPDAEAVRQAANSYDAGVRAWNEGRYAEAASHFEAADAAVPSSVSLGEAIKARRRAGHPARTATLAALARQRHAEDAGLRALADQALAALAPSLHRLEVVCSAPCVLAAGTRSIAGAPAKHRVIYVTPGEVTISASFVDGAEGAKQGIVARAGGNNSLYLRPPAKHGEQLEPSEGGGVPRRPGAGRSAVERPTGPPAATGAALPRSPAPAAPPAGVTAEEPWRGISPVWFFVGAGATTVLGAITIWSGVDTISDPGQDTVRELCVGLGPDCPAYREGLDKETRTNALIGATAATAAVTAVVGLLLTDWGGEPHDDGETAANAQPRIMLGRGLRLMF